jgi:hypothetical protein
MRNMKLHNETRALLDQLAARTDHEPQAQAIIAVLSKAGPQCCSCCDGDGDYRTLIADIRDALPPCPQ